MRRFKAKLVVAFSALMQSASLALAQAPPPPPPVLTAESKDNSCGWGLGGAAAGLGAAYYLGGSGAPSANWSGLYFGGHLGCAWTDTKWNFPLASVYSRAGESASFDNSGMIGGAQIGYNFQSGNWVYGIEASLSGGDLSDQVVNSPNPAPATRSTRYTSDIRWLVQVTPRLGYAFAPRMHGYVKAGFASAELDSSLFVTDGVVTLQHVSNAWHKGWTVGAGLEYMLAQNVILGVDYSFVNLNANDRAPCNAPNTCLATQVPYRVDPGDIHMLTGRISFKVGGDRAPAPLK